MAIELANKKTRKRMDESANCVQVKRDYLFKCSSMFFVKKTRPGTEVKRNQVKGKKGRKSEGGGRSK